jgi:hypothetical protein
VRAAVQDATDRKPQALPNSCHVPSGRFAHKMRTICMAAVSARTLQIGARIPIIALQ